MKQGMKVFVGVLLLCMIFTSIPMAFADDTLMWLEADAPPFYIFDGPLKGQGYQAVVTDLIAKELPQYEHKHSLANMSRHYELFKSGAQACALALYKKPEREEIAYFSIPSFATLPGVLVISKKSYQAFGGKDVVNLEKLLKENKLIFGLNKRRSFGSSVDELFATYGTAQNIFEYEGDELSRNFFEMLGRGRVDAFVGLPEEIVYQAERLGLQDTIMTVGIEENLNDAIGGAVCYVACSKSPWGKQAISDINRVLVKLRPTDAYRGAYERWIGKESVEQYRQLYKEGVLAVTK